MPSPESQALEQQFRAMSGRMAANPAMDLETLRELVEPVHLRASEPTDVTYEEITIGDRGALWAKPLDADRSRVILYTHGGGYIANTMHTARKAIGHLAKAAGTLALTPDYRLAPEHPFPAQLEDTTAAYRWLLERGFEAHSIAIAGESAGGNLATGTALKLREMSLPLPGAIIGFSPWFDLLGETETFDTNAATDGFLSRDASAMMASMFLGGADPHGPLTNPRHADLAGLPPMYLTAGGHETLLSAITDFADRARAQGVQVELEIAAGQQHAFVYMAGRAPEADNTLGRVGTWVRETLGTCDAARDRL